jgi:enoyl-CoA hydratase/carnithine racemase
MIPFNDSFHAGTAALASTREDPSIACAVVTGAGDKAFSAGGDFFAMKRPNWINGCWPT